MRLLGVGRENTQNVAKKSEERPWKSAGKYSTSNGRGFLPLDKSQGKHPKPPPRPQIPVDADDWTSSSTIFTVCRRIDLSMRERLVPPDARENWERGHGLRLCVHINRDNRRSPGAAYRVGDPGGMATESTGMLGLRREFCSRAGTLHANGSRLLWEERVIWICEVENKTQKKREREKWMERRTTQGMEWETIGSWKSGNSHGGIEKWRN